MTKEEIKFHCVKIACDILGAYGGRSAITKGEIEVGGKRESPSVNDVLEKAKQIYDYVMAEN